MFGFITDPSRWRKFYAALVPVIAFAVTYFYGDALGAKVQEFLMLVEVALVPLLVGAVPNET